MVLSYALWLGAIGFETALLIHLLRLHLVVRYPYFFFYLTLTWANSGISWVAYHHWSAHYPWIVWIGELLTVLAGFLLVWEVFRQTFFPFPAIRLRASWLVLALILLLLGGNLLLAVLGGPRGDHLFFQLERWLRLLQAGFLAAILGVARHYSLPLGRNVAGLAIGFGLYVSLTVVNFATQALAHIDLSQLNHLYAVTFLLTLVIWCHALWILAPNPAPPRRAHLEQDYARLNAIVAGAVLRLRGSRRKASGA